MKPKYVTIEAGLHDFDEDIQWKLIQALANEIRIHEPEEGNPEDTAISRLAMEVFTITNKPQ
jgi:hypothetical protein